MHIYVKGDRVHQVTYGTGTVTEADGRYTSVDFDDHGVRKFSTPIANFERTAVPAPERPAQKGRAKSARRKSTRSSTAITAAPTVEAVGPGELSEQ
jgi:hypothetical protein